ncbi:MAG: DUF2285 domain-containing protein [Sphingobium sp.]
MTLKWPTTCPGWTRSPPYDEARLCLYLRLLDAEAEGADWRDVSRIVLHRDAAAEPDRTRRCWEAHLKRARWIAAIRHRELMGKG